MNTRLFILFCSSFFFISSIVTAQNFSWEKGDTFGNTPGSYGAVGVPAASNNPYGRSECASWKDAEGNLWIFGGTRTIYNTSPHLMNDLLKYDLITKEWTWKKGSAYNSNSFGVYGQQGVAAMANTPGARENAASWTDKSGKLWLFGGIGLVASGSPSYLNDLWNYDPQTNMWTWVKGSNQTFQLGTTGTMGVPAPGNTPGSRLGSITWVDADGDLWLYGGYGRSANSNLYQLCDLWRYNIANNTWTWMYGNSASPFGIYTSYGVTGSLDHPSGRQDAGSWTDGNGNLWLFGGFGWTDQYDGGYKFLNDVWKYEIATGLWTWVKGSDVSDKVPVHGTQGVAATPNTPGGRWGFAYGGDAAGNFWVFGGRQTDGNALNDQVSDLWRYTLSDNKWTWMAGSPLIYQPGIYGTMGVPDPGNSPGSREESCGWCDNSGNFWLFGGFGKDINSTYGYLNDLWKFGNCTEGSYTINSSNTELCEGQSTTLTVAFTGTINWSTGETGSSIVVTPTIGANYNVDLNDNYGCAFSVSYAANVSVCESLSEQSGHTNLVSLHPNPSNGLVNLHGAVNSQQTLRIYNTLGVLVYSQIVVSVEQSLQLNLAPGIYYYSTDPESHSSSGKKLIIY